MTNFRAKMLIVDAGKSGEISEEIVDHFINTIERFEFYIDNNEIKHLPTIEDVFIRMYSSFLSEDYIKGNKTKKERCVERINAVLKFIKLTTIKQTVNGVRIYKLSDIIGIDLNLKSIFKDEDLKLFELDSSFCARERIRIAKYLANSKTNAKIKEKLMNNIDLQKKEAYML